MQGSIVKLNSYRLLLNKQIHYLLRTKKMIKNKKGLEMKQMNKMKGLDKKQWKNIKG